MIVGSPYDPLSCLTHYAVYQTGQIYVVSLEWIATEGASATRNLTPLLGKTKLTTLPCRKHVSSYDYLPLTIEISQEMKLNVFTTISQRSSI